VDSAPSLVDGGVEVRVPSGVGIGDRNIAERLTGGVDNLLAFLLGFGQRVWGVRITVRPTIYGDGRDIFVGVEASWSQHSRQIFSDLAFEIFEFSAEQSFA